MATPINPVPITKPTTVGSLMDINSIMSFLTTNIVIIVILIAIPFGIILFFYIIKKLKKFDPFQQDFQIKKSQCKMFKKEGIKKVYIENDHDGLVKMGNYEGECLDKEGYHNIMFSRFKFGIVGRWLRRILFFTAPILDLLLKKYWIVRCNVNTIYKNKIVDATTKVVTSEDIKLPITKLTAGGDSLIIHCDGLQLKKYYTYPIVKGTDSVLQDETVNFERERDSVLTNTLYEQTIDFANVMREAINLNPSLRYVMKTEGKSLPDSGGGQS
jgi:hypothetical protein